MENLHLENKSFFLNRFVFFCAKEIHDIFFVMTSFVHSLLVEVSSPQAAQAMIYTGFLVFPIT